MKKSHYKCNDVLLAIDGMSKFNSPYTISVQASYKWESVPFPFLYPRLCWVLDRRTSYLKG